MVVMVPMKSSFDVPIYETYHVDRAVKLASLFDSDLREIRTRSK